MKFRSLSRLLPTWKNALLAAVSAVLLILAFPDFEYWFLAWFALIPLFWAVEREQASTAKSFALGWIFGTCFIYGTCWWLTFAPITYGGFPPALAYFLMFFVCLAVGIFPALFAAVLSQLFRRFGSYAILAAPFVWTFTEFLRYWLTGNNWNAIGYSQAFGRNSVLQLAGIGGVYLTGFCVVLISACIFFVIRNRERTREKYIVGLSALLILTALFLFDRRPVTSPQVPKNGTPVIAIQVNVPMSGLNVEKWNRLRQRHVELAESALQKLNEQQTTNNGQRVTFIFPESPMNFMYKEDVEFQEFVRAFAVKHNANVLFNSAEPNPANDQYFNSALLFDPRGNEVVQYDKIYLVPFGEFVPSPFEGILPSLIGSFSHGSEYDLLAIGNAKAGVMLCYESHFGSLSREFVLRGADVIIEMTNDGYLGPTPVLRQHLANAVFRAVETNRPVLRATNVGITAYINENGAVLDATQPYQEDTRIWSVSKSDGSQTFYVRYGDWFAWLCSVVTIVLLMFGLIRRPELSEPTSLADG